jgi:hypothetical protein
MEIPRTVRRFACQTCGADVTFTDAHCANCAVELGFFHEHGDLLPIEVGSDATFHERSGRDGEWWRCLNAAWGCNWMVRAGAGNVWCAACRLTRGRPDESNLDAVRAWSVAEAAKRRLVAQLHSLGLPIDPPSPDHDDGLVFDLVYLPESVGVTGHRPGVITLDLREVDDGFREAARVHFREQYRTVLGHLRHETGHHLWNRLVVRPGALDEARELFGDERADYRAALEAHYSEMPVTPADDVPQSYLSEYASVHPSEDWAETFAHYLHLRDGLETAREFGLDDDADVALVVEHTDHAEFSATIDRWRRLSRAVNEMSLGLGHPAVYGVTIGPGVEAKLRYVHQRVTAAARVPER